MSFTTLIRLSAVMACVMLGAGAPAQDANTIAAAANKNKAAIQQKLATKKDKPDWARLRVDGFEAAGDQTIKVAGVFLDTGLPPTGNNPWSPTFDQIKDDLEELILTTAGYKKGDVRIDWSELVRVGGIGRLRAALAAIAADLAGKPFETPIGLGDNPRPPHLVVMEAANVAGAKNALADRVALNGSRFGSNGELLLLGWRDKEETVGKWLEAEVKVVLAGHPAAGKQPVGLAAVKGAEWPVSAAALQRTLATANDKKLHILWVDRAYFVLNSISSDPTDRWSELILKVDGMRMGTAVAVDESLPRGLVEPAVKQLIPTAQVDVTGLVLGYDEPWKELHKAVAANRKLDGVRCDPGITFGSDGEIQLSGIQPGLDADGQKELERVVQQALIGFARTQLEEKADKYRRLATRPVTVKRMSLLPLMRVLDELRAWAVASKDDLKLIRLYFPEPGEWAALKPGAEYFKEGERIRYYVNVNGLVLVYLPSVEADIREVAVKFRALLKEYVETGIPDPPPAGKVGAADLSSALVLLQPPGDDRPLMPGLTPYLRKEMARDPKNKWYGVLIERGYFDKNNRYTLIGVVDAPEQNAELDKLLKQLSTDPRWAEYFEPGPNPVAMSVIPMKGMVDRVKRVTPAYSDFDGVQVESARYDEDMNLVFEVRCVGRTASFQEVRLADLLTADPTYTRRVVKPSPSPVESKLSPKPPAKVKLVRVGGAPYTNDQIADFSLGYGAKLLSVAHRSPADMVRAKEWLDIGLMHYPNEASVWFLSAYYNQLQGDYELVYRDMYRVVQLEGQLAFNGPAQRKRRYEAAKELQGPLRNELEERWLQDFRDINDGAIQITMTPSARWFVMSAAAHTHHGAAAATKSR